MLAPPAAVVDVGAVAGEPVIIELGVSYAALAGVEAEAHRVVLTRTAAEMQPGMAVGQHSGFPANESAARQVDPGGVEVDEHRVRTPEEPIPRLDVPVDGGHGVKHPQGLAQQPDDLPGLRRRAQGVLEQKVQDVPLDVLLNDDILSIPLRRLIDQGQAAAGAARQLPVDRAIFGEAAEDELLAAFPAADQAHAALGPSFSRRTSSNSRFRCSDGQA